jgi:hypothetical protein
MNHTLALFSSMHEHTNVSVIVSNFFHAYEAYFLSWWLRAEALTLPPVYRLKQTKPATFLNFPV